MTYGGPIIDCDVHHHWPQDAEVVKYMSRKWRDHIKDSGISLYPPQIRYPPQYGTIDRFDAFPANGGPAGSDYATLRNQLLDGMGVTRAVLGYAVGQQTGHANPYLNAEVARAANDWSIETWLNGRDNRLFGAVLVAPQLPERAAAEVIRSGKHSRMVEVLMVANGLGQPFGHPAYHPIYRAASQVGLPVAIHAGGDNSGPALFAAGGLPNTRLEFYAVSSQPAMHHLVSFITHGVFEKFPDLKVIFIESGYNWAPWIIWELDARYDLLRRESPWVRRRPLDYLQKHIRFSTQPTEVGRDPAQLRRLLTAFDGFGELLCFATDYPHWDTDEPRYIARLLPPQWLANVFWNNANAFHRWPKGS